MLSEVGKPKNQQEEASVCTIAFVNTSFIFKLLGKLPDRLERLAKTAKSHPFFQESFWEEVRLNYKGEDAQLKHYYKVLELPYGAKPSEVKQAYKRLMKTYHPDKFQTKEKKALATELVKKINEAYQLILKHSESSQGL